MGGQESPWGVPRQGRAVAEGAPRCRDGEGPQRPSRGSACSGLPASCGLAGLPSGAPDAEAWVRSDRKAGAWIVGRLWAVPSWGCGRLAGQWSS